MKQKGVRFSFVFAFIVTSILFIPSFLLSDYQYVLEPKSDVYFGHISYSEVKYDGKDPVVLREGEKYSEIAVLNLPLTAGDIIRTTDSRRCEIQFDTGTIIRLDYATELKIETVLAQGLSSRSKVTNLVLLKGQIYIMYRRYSSRELFQVITPNAAVKLDHRIIGLIKVAEDGSADVQVKSGKAYVLYGVDEDMLEEKKIGKLERLVVSNAHKVELEEYKPDVDFELWNDYINQNFEALHKGQSFIPKPIQRYPKAVYYFAQKYSNLYGGWVWNSLYGWVWRPNYNDYYPGGAWQPYIYGNWREINEQLFWVPEEQWGWAPYHLGVWVWDKKHGWLWIPGSAFAPAWATWDFFMGYYSWRPWYLWDWYYQYGYGYSGRGYYGYGYGYYYPYWRNYTDLEGEKGKPVRRAISKNQLKKKQGSSYPMPKDLKRAYDRAVSALEKGDERVIGSIKRIPEHLVFVRDKDLNSPRIQEKILRIGQVSKQIESSQSRSEEIPWKVVQTPQQKAVWTFKRNIKISQLRDYVISYFVRKKEQKSAAGKELSFPERKTAISPRTNLGQKGKYVSLAWTQVSRIPSSKRFRDWNPDVKNAQRLGVEITYSSRTNEVRCPSLGLSSRTARVGSVSKGGFYSRSSHSSSSSSSSGSSSESSSSGSASKSSSGSSSKSGGSKGSSKVKNN